MFARRYARLTIFELLMILQKCRLIAAKVPRALLHAGGG